MRHSSRFYAIHMLLIPGGLFALIGLHLLPGHPARGHSASVDGERCRVRGADEQPARTFRPRIASAAREREDDSGRPEGRPVSSVRPEGAVQALQGGRREAREAVLPARHVPRHRDEHGRGLRHRGAGLHLVLHFRRGGGRRRSSRSALRGKGQSGSESAYSCRGPTGTSTFSSTSLRILNRRSR